MNSLYTAGFWYSTVSLTPAITSEIWKKKHIEIFDTSFRYLKHWATRYYSPCLQRGTSKLYVRITETRLVRRFIRKHPIEGLVQWVWSISRSFKVSTLISHLTRHSFDFGITKKWLGSLHDTDVPKFCKHWNLNELENMQLLKWWL